MLGSPDFGRNDCKLRSTLDSAQCSLPSGRGFARSEGTRSRRLCFTTGWLARNAQRARSLAAAEPSALLLPRSVGQALAGSAEVGCGEFAQFALAATLGYQDYSRQL